MRLWEISAELVALSEQILDAGGEMSPEVEDRLQAMEGDFEGKVEQIALLIREHQTEADRAQAEQARLAGIAKAHDNAAKRLKDYLLRCMGDAGVTKIETHRARVRVQRNSAPAVAFAGDLALLHPSWVRVIPESYALDRDAVLVALKSGESLPDGVVVTYGSHVRIA